MPTDRKYPVAYAIEVRPPDSPEGAFTKKELKAKGLGGADAFLCASVMTENGDHREGSISYMFASGDGSTGKEMDAELKFKVWVHLANALKNDPTLSPGKRALCSQVFEIVRAAILEGRKH